MADRVAVDRNGDPRFSEGEMNDLQIGLILADLGKLLAKGGVSRLVPVEDAEDGIIAYAVSEFNANRIVDALSRVEPDWADEKRPELADPRH